MKKIAVFPGSFDPFTKGHESVIDKSIDLFDEIIIAFGVNTSKVYSFETAKRIKHVESLYETNSKIRVVSYQGMTTDFCKQENAKYILRGLRDTKDFEYERAIAQMNLELSGIETVLFYTDPKVAAISSTIIREIFKSGGNISRFVTNSNELV